MDKHYDLIFVGAGPATIGALLFLIDSGYKGSICVIEKGKSLKTRSPKEVVSGFAGAGAFSDCKISSDFQNRVGGALPNLTEEEFNIYQAFLLKYFNHFNKGTGYEGKIELRDGSLAPKCLTNSTSNLKWSSHKVCHVGSDRGKSIFSNMENFILEQPNISMLYETEVIKIDIEETKIGEPQGKYMIYTSNEDYFTCNKLIIATGQKNTLPGKLMTQFNLETIPRAFQLGIRVRDQMNPNYEEIIASNYDFKFNKQYEFPNNIKINVRTFCCNSGNAHVCAEVNSEGFTCFNGHALKTPDPNNCSVNYGIMCEVEGLEGFDTKQSQIELMKRVNNNSRWHEDNFDVEGNVHPNVALHTGFHNTLIDIYPWEVVSALNDFIFELNKVVPLARAYYLYPEVKLNEGKMVKTNKRCETSEPNLYFIGDCNSTRGILKAFIQGLQFADYLQLK